jgi:H+/Cl- antiporter ClcA
MLFTGILFLFFGYFLPYIFNKNISKESKSNYLQRAFFAIIIGSILLTYTVRSVNQPHNNDKTIQLPGNENQMAAASFTSVNN